MAGATRASQGFGHDISIDLGETIFFKIKTDSTHYRIDIYRMGWYAGLGARLVDTVAPSMPLPQSQPEGLRDPATRLYDCGNWAVSASWTAPKDAVSGNLLRAPRSPGPGAGAGRLARRPFAHPTRCPPRGSRARLRFPRPRAASHRAARAAREPHLLRRARRREPLRHPVPDRRHHLAGLQPLRRTLHLRTPRSRAPAPARGAAARLQGELQPPARDPPLPGREHRLQRGVPLRAFPRGERLRRELHHRRRQRPAGRTHRESPAFSLRGARRVLVGAPAAQRRGGARCGSASRVLQRQRGVLEDPLRAQHRRKRGAVPDPRHLQGDPRQRQDRPDPRRVDGHLAGLALLQPRGAAAGERAHGHHLHP